MRPCLPLVRALPVAFLLAACAGSARPTTAPLPTAPVTAGTPAMRSSATAGTPVAGTRAVGDAYRALQALDSYQLTLALTGFSVAGQRGDLRVVSDIRKGVTGDDIHLAVSAGGKPVLEGKLTGRRVAIRQPGGAYATVGPTDTAAIALQTFADLPKAILTNLTPATARYTSAGSETVNGRAATRYTATVPLASLGFVDPALQSQRGIATSTVWVADDGAYLVAADATIQAEGSMTTIARLRLDVTPK